MNTAKVDKLMHIRICDSCCKKNVLENFQYKHTSIEMWANQKLSALQLY